MSSLAEEFLADFSDEEEEEEEVEESERTKKLLLEREKELKQKKEEGENSDVEMEEEGSKRNEERREAEEFEDELEDVELDRKLKDINDVRKIATLATSKELQELLEEVRSRMQVQRTEGLKGSLEEDEEYPLLMKCNQYSVSIEDEIVIIHKFIRDHYSKKFPELSQQLPNPLDYARVVKRIGNEMDLTQVNLADILPQSSIMVITVTGSTTQGSPLEESELARVLESCEDILNLDEMKHQLLRFVESRMTIIAPNLSAIVGTAVAAQLIGAAGGLEELSKIPSCNVQLLGVHKRALAGFSTKTTIKHVGFIYNCDLINNTPPHLRKKVGRIIAGKCTLAARVDSFQNEFSGVKGRQLREEIERTIVKLQEPPPPKLEKPLPAPDDRPKKKRGGKRVRRMKERYKVTDLMKLRNRMKFGEAEEEARAEFGMKGLGMLTEGSGKLKVKAETKVKQKKVKDKMFGTGGGTSGLSSSLVFTPVQGLELENPHMSALQKRQKEEQEKYFSSVSGFFKVGSKSNPPK